MPANDNSCPDKFTLEAFAFGSLEDDDLIEVKEHVEKCKPCFDKVKKHTRKVAG